MPLNNLSHFSVLHIHQKRELAELIGFETRNKYAITSENGEPVGFAAEQHKGIWGFLFRQALGHWRRFEIHFFDPKRRLVMKARHPFRFFFQRLEVLTTDGQLIGALQQRFAIFSKKFDLEDSSGRVLMQVSSPFWKIWTFPFRKEGREVAMIEKKWTGLLAEAFTDKDRFRLRVTDETLSHEDRLLLVAAAVFIDLQYFEKKAGSSG